LLLASIVEKVSHKPFGKFLQDNIFDAASMGNTSLRWTRPPKRPFSSDNFYQTYGSGGILTTAGDLYRYDQALYDGKLLPKKSLKPAFKRVKLLDSSVSNYGFGWRVNQSDTGKGVYHVGDGVGIRASIQRFLDTEKTLIFIHAHSNQYQEPVYWAIRNIWEGKPYDLPQKRIVYDINPRLYDQYVGSYLSKFGLVHVSTENGKLYLRPDPIPGKEELIPSSDTTFYFSNQNVEWQFFLDEAGKVQGFGIKGDRENMGKRQE